MSERSENGSRSVERALRLLHAVAVSTEGLTLTRAAQSSELATSTAARLLNSLENTGFAVRDDHGFYRPGVRMLQIGAAALSGYTLDSVAADHLRELADFTGETAYLAVPDGPDLAVYLQQVESPRAIRHATWTGRAIPTSGTALGAALALRVNDDGYATSQLCAVEPDASSAAAPIIDADGRAFAAISVIGPSFRLTSDDLNSFGHALAKHATAISERMRLHAR